MKTRLLSLSCFAFCFFAYSQFIPVPSSEFYFKYDEAGNQIFRGIEERGSRYNGSVILKKNISEDSTLSSNMTIEEQERFFWNNIKIYPVPVKDVLTIEWDGNVNQVISEVSVFQHTTLANLFTQQNLPNINRRVKIDMSRYYFGVYILSFKLKNGKTMTRNITKQ